MQPIYKLECYPKRGFLFTFLSIIPILFVLVLGTVLFVGSIYLIINNIRQFNPILLITFGAGLFTVIGSLFMIKVLLWINFGKETILVYKDALVINRRMALGVADLSVPIASVKNLRIVGKLNFSHLEIYPVHFESKAIYAPEKGGRFAFDIGTETFYFGNFISDVEAHLFLDFMIQSCPNTIQLSELNALKFEGIKVIKERDKIEISFTSKKDPWSIVGLFCWWLAWTTATVFCYQYTEQVTIFFYILPVVSISMIFFILSLIYRKERIIITSNEVVFRKPFYFTLRKKVKKEDIRAIELKDEIVLEKYWGIGSKKNKNYTYRAKLGNRLSVRLPITLHPFGEGLSYPEGQYIKSLLDH